MGRKRLDKGKEFMASVNHNRARVSCAQAMNRNPNDAKTLEAAKKFRTKSYYQSCKRKETV